MPAATDRALVIAAELSAATYAFSAACDGAGVAADEVARLERDYTAALSQAGIRDARPPIRETCAELLHGRVQALHPHIPFTTSASADRAARMLESWAPPAELVQAAQRP